LAGVNGLLASAAEQVFFFLLLAAWLALFQFMGNSVLGYIHTSSLFSWMHEAYRSSGGSANDDAHGNFIHFWSSAVLVEAEGAAGVVIPYLVARAAAAHRGMMLHISVMSCNSRASPSWRCSPGFMVDGLAWGANGCGKVFSRSSFLFFRFLWAIKPSSLRFHCNCW